MKLEQQLVNDFLMKQGMSPLSDKYTFEKFVKKYFRKLAFLQQLISHGDFEKKMHKVAKRLKTAYEKIEKSVSAKAARKLRAKAASMEYQLTKQQEVSKALVKDAQNRIKGRKTKIKEGFVYVLSCERISNWCKVGFTTNLSKRLAAYQTGSPFKDYKFEHVCFCDDCREVEKELLARMDQFRGQGEWINLPSLNVVKFISKNYARC